MAEQQFEIIKASGKRELFDPKKLQHSLERAGAGPEQIEKIFDELEKQMYDGISTRRIYKLAFKKLKSISRGMAGRYKLKQAIMELGPTGFPFEKFVGQLLRHQGYSVSTDQSLEGHCISHEVDVIAVNDSKKHYIECKFRNRQDDKCDVKIPLYIKSRFDDLSNAEDDKSSSIHGWVVTNTRFTRDALDYGSCAGLRMISWDHPDQGSLKRMIELARLYPITCLASASSSIKQKLLDENIVICKEILQNEQLLEKATDKPQTKRAIMQEIEDLCGS